MFIQQSPSETEQKALDAASTGDMSLMRGVVEPSLVPVYRYLTGLGAPNAADATVDALTLALANIERRPSNWSFATFALAAARRSWRASLGDQKSGSAFRAAAPVPGCEGLDGIGPDEREAWVLLRVVGVSPELAATLSRLSQESVVALAHAAESRLDTDAIGGKP